MNTMELSVYYVICSLIVDLGENKINMGIIGEI